ncbi:MAG: glutamate-1-semialdehyde-2,1-aminomutase [Caldithrix sp.]|nr:MAG: glutamate-1-semialdehyde-2,1-aminomutase [Caldithrix sp.]
MNTQASEKLYHRAGTVLPGGVNSPVRAFKAVGGTPLFIERAEGAYLIDVDGNRYVDYVGSWGPMLIGHAHPQIINAVRTALSKGTSYGAPTEVEVELAEMVIDAVPSVEMVRFVNSGTEATMSALRLARAYTKRDKIVKFEGCYHGHADMLLVQAGSGVTTLGLPDSPGVPDSAVADTLVAQFNNLDSVQNLFEQNPAEIAAIIVEPIAGNMGVVPPQAGFLEGLRKIAGAGGALLVFDEVMTGFRVAFGGAQSLFKVTPDLSCLGKIIGGGFPVGAYGGRKEIMELVAPSGPVYQAGTLSGNPIAMTAGLETLKILKKTGTYDKLEHLSEKLAHGIRQAAESVGLPLFQTRVGSMSGMFFTSKKVVDLATAKTSDTKKYARFFTEMLNRGIYFAPSQFEAAFVSLAHDQEQIDQTISAAKEIFEIISS